MFSAGCVDYAFCDLAAKIRVKNRDPVQVYAMEMEPQERVADLDDDSPVVRFCDNFVFVYYFSPISGQCLPAYLCYSYMSCQFSCN